jgi:hypothetical protein
MAKEGEILLTAAANERALGCGLTTERQDVTVSQLEVSYYRLACSG